MFTTDSVARPKVLGGMAWCQSPEEADLRRVAHVSPETHDHDQDAHNAPRATGKVRSPHRERNVRNEKVRGSSPPKSAASDHRHPVGRAIVVVLEERHDKVRAAVFAIAVAHAALLTEGDQGGTHLSSLRGTVPAGRPYRVVATSGNDHDRPELRYGAAPAETWTPRLPSPTIGVPRSPRAHGLPGRALPCLAAMRMIIAEGRADQLHLGLRRHSRTSSLSGG